jgi:hypothetical protein
VTQDRRRAIRSNRSKGSSRSNRPAFKEINAEKILPLSMEEVQAKYKKYVDEYRNYLGK